MVAGGYRRLEQRLGSNVWQVQTGWGAVWGGPTPPPPLVLPLPGGVGGGVTWLMNNKKSTGQHSRRKFSVGLY